MNNSDKIIIGGSIVMIASAAVMVFLTKKCKDTTTDVISRLMNIQFTLNQCNTELVTGNKEISDAGILLRKLVKNQADENSKSAV